MRSKSLGLAIIGSVILGTTADAGPLDPPACQQLREQIVTMEKAGVRTNFEKGAAWAKANLKRDQLSEVERLIDAESQFLFRCPQPKRKFDPGTEALLENGTGSDPDPDAPKTDAVVPKPAALKVQPKPKAPAKVPAETQTDQAPPPVATPKKAAAKPKPKATDAFVPPPGAPQSTLAPPVAQ